MSKRTSEWFQQVENILEQALLRPASERAKFLKTACADDENLRREIQSMLDADVPDILETGGAQRAAVDAVASNLVDALGPGSEVGNYRLIEEIGAGGMSRVYLATREGVDFEQKVALKLMRTFSTGGEESLRRFSIERQVLASLSHPNIAKIIDGGVTSMNRPYLVMEYVEGMSIIHYCQSRNLDLYQRINLFIDVCTAVQHAHQRLIVHRDIKPSNILVDNEGHVKLLDFGIAKLLDPPDSLDVTRTGFLMLTPQYASPEQLTGADITTATDIYSLGLVLYEILTGQRPFDVTGKSAAEQIHQICNEVPSSLKSVTTQIGSNTKDTVRWSSLLRGDLDLIVGKTLAKNPEERYYSCLELVQDLERWGDGRPVLAHAPRFTYRARKFAGRHRLALSSFAVVLILITFFVAALFKEQSETRVERDRAQQAEAATGALNEFLMNEFVGAASPDQAQGDDPTLAQVIDRAAIAAGSTFQDQPQIEAAVRNSLGQTYLRLGRLDDAADNFKVAESHLKTLFPPDHPDILRIGVSRTMLELARGNFEAASVQISDTLERQQRVLGKTHLDTLVSRRLFGRVEHALGNWPAAESILTATIADLEQHHPEAWREEFQALSALVRLYRDQRRSSEARIVVERLLPLQRKHLGQQHPDVIESLTLYSTVLHQLILNDEATSAATESLNLGRKVFGEHHPSLTPVIRHLGILHLRARRYEEAEILYRDALAGFSKRLGKQHLSAIEMRGRLAVVFAYTGRRAEAVELYEQVAEEFTQLQGERHPNTIRVLKNMSISLDVLGRTAERRLVVERIVGIAKSFAKDEDADPVQISDLAEYLLTCRPEDLRDPTTALVMAEFAVAKTKRKHGDALITLGLALRTHGRVEEAISILEDAATLPSALHMPAIPRMLDELYLENGEQERAEQFFKAHLARQRQFRPDDDHLIGMTLLNLGRSYVNHGRGDLAEPVLRDAIAQLRRTLPVDNVYVHRSQAALGAALGQIGLFEEAQDRLLDAFNNIRSDPQTTAKIKIEMLGWIADLYQLWGRPDEAALWRSELAARQNAPEYSSW